jgi:hypothetical protein
MRLVPALLATHLDQEVTSLATVWKIIRQDNVTFRLTDCDVPLTVAGEVYSSVNSYQRTAIDTALGLRSDNMEINGFFDNASITQQDIDNGLFDGAELRIWIVNHLDTSQGVIALMRGKLGEFEHTEEGLFNATFRSIAEAFRNRIGNKSSATCRTELGSLKCKVPVQPPLVQRGRSYAVGDFVRVLTNASGITRYAVPFVNPSFESALGAEWDVVQGFVTRSTNLEGIGPYVGSQLLRGDTNGATNQVEQVVDLDTIVGLDLDLIDTGRATISGGARALSGTLTSVPKGRVVYELLDEADDVTAVLLDTDFITFYPQLTWVQQTYADKPIPPLSRKLRVTLWMQRDPATLYARIAFDDILSEITTYASGYGFQTSFENRIYECTTAGATATSAPTYDTVVGNPTTDGTAVFTAREAFMRHATIATVTDRRTFTITVTESRAVDAWFADGSVTIESGANLGKTIEVKTWTDAGNIVQCFLPFAFDLAPGDQLRISPGCDKTRPTCRDKFVITGSTDFALGNVKNFRGEPDVPIQETLQLKTATSVQPRAPASSTPRSGSKYG